MKERLLTAADLARLPEWLPSGDVRYELDDGRLVVLPPLTWDHSTIQMKILRALFKQGEDRGFGKAMLSVGIVLRRDPDRVVGCDALFITEDQYPKKVSAEDYLETIPSIVVEIRDRYETAADLESKAREYLSAGGNEIWVLDGIARNARIFTSAGVREFGVADTLVTRLLPGFALPVADLLIDADDIPPKHFLAGASD